MKNNKSKSKTPLRTVPTGGDKPTAPVTEHVLSAEMQKQLRELDAALVQNRLRLAELALQSEIVKQLLTQQAAAVQGAQAKLQAAVKVVAESYDIDLETTTEKWNLDFNEMVLRRIS